MSEYDDVLLENTDGYNFFRKYNVDFSEYIQAVPVVSNESLKPFSDCWKKPGLRTVLLTKGEGISADLQSQLNEIVFEVRKKISGDNLKRELSQREIKNLGDQLEKNSKTFIDKISPDLLKDKAKLEVTLLSFLYKNRSGGRRKTSIKQFNSISDQSYSFSLCCAVATYLMAMQVIGLMSFPAKARREKALSGADGEDLVIQFTKDPSMEIRLQGEIENNCSGGDKTVKFSRISQLGEKNGDFLKLLSTPNYKNKQAPLIFFRAKFSELDLSLLSPKTTLVLIEKDEKYVFFTGFFKIERLRGDIKLWKQVYNREVLVLNLPIEGGENLDGMMAKWSGTMRFYQQLVASLFKEEEGKNNDVSKLEIDCLLKTTKLDVADILGVMPADEDYHDTGSFEFQRGKE